MNAATPPASAPTPTAADGRILDEIEEVLARFVAFPLDASRRAVALWVLHTHAFEYASATPYLNVHSPAPRCGKSTLFELLALLVRDAVGGSNMSPAVLYRLIDAQHPTLLLDELDAQLRADREKAAAIQSILNAGYKRGATAVVWRCEPPTFKPVSFNVFAPKAFAGIGSANLHPTTLDRSISILLERKLPSDATARFRSGRVEDEAGALRTRMIEWVDEHANELAHADPELPDALDDRAQEIWEPLLAIADITGGKWPTRARRDAVELHCQPDLDDLPLSIQLLSDTRRVFDEAEMWTVSSEEMCSRLRAFDESPWGSWMTNGVRTGINPRALARFLRPFTIRPKTVRLGGEDKPTIKGYRRDWFDSAWERYLAPEQATDDDT